MAAHRKESTTHQPTEILFRETVVDRRDTEHSYDVIPRDGTPVFIEADGARYVVEADEHKVSVLGLQAASRARHGGKPDRLTKAGEQLVDLSWPDTATAHAVNVEMTPSTTESTARYRVTAPDIESGKNTAGFRMVESPNNEALWVIPESGETLRLYEPVEI
jgi:hypothetical protein